MCTCNSYSVNAGCTAYTNLSYTATNYLPIQSVNAQSNATLYTNYTGYYTNPTSIPVCNNLSDSISIYLNVSNLYACNALNTSRTYSFFIDNILLDMAVCTGSANYNVVSGSSSQCSISESYYDNATSLWMRILPQTTLSVGNHLFEIKSSPLYTSTVAVVNYSCNIIAQPCRSVSGKIYADCDHNCVKSTGDGNLYTGAIVRIFNGVNSFTIYPDATGNYTGMAPSIGPQYSITSMPLAWTFTPCPAATATTAFTGTISTTMDFGYSTNSNYTDPSASSAIIFGGISPGQTKVVSTHWYNSAFLYTPCTFTVAANPGKFKMVLDKNLAYLNPVSPTPAPNSIITGPTGDTLVWNVPNFSINYTQYYDVLTQLSPTVAVGTTYTNYTYVSSLYDNFFGNNSAVFTWSVGVPCDPNNKISYATGMHPNGDIPLLTTDLYYTINFQNVGTVPAVNVKTIDTLDSHLDWTTLQILNSSYPVQTQLDNVSGQVIFYFANINLPDSTMNEKASHGFVHYKLKLNPGLPAGTVIKNRAYNYFDFNAPVATNQTKNTLVNFAGIHELELAASVYLAPNPVTDKINISAGEMIRSISVYDNLGQIVLKQDVNNSLSQMDLSPLTEGVYFVSLQFKDGSKITKKVVKN